MIRSALDDERGPGRGFHPLPGHQQPESLAGLRTGWQAKRSASSSEKIARCEGVRSDRRFCDMLRDIRLQEATCSAVQKEETD